jgi:hypothetical protein
MSATTNAELNLKECLKMVKCLIENHAGHQFGVEAETILEALKKLAKRLMYEDNNEAGFKVIEVDGKKLSNAGRFMEVDIALWEYKAYQNNGGELDFWGWNGKRNIDDEMAVEICYKTAPEALIKKLVIG